MKTIYTLLITALLAFGCTTDKSTSESSNNEEISTPSTETTSNDIATEAIETKADYFFKDLDGKYYNLEDFKGKRVFINFWATWCKPCVAEMPSIERAAKILGEENYIFFLVSDQDMSKIKKFRDKKGFDLNFAKFNGSIEDLKIRSLPTTFIYDTEGNKAKQFSGSLEWDNEKILDNLRSVK